MTATKSCNDSANVRAAKAVSARVAQQAVAKMFHQSGRDFPDAFARLGRRRGRASVCLPPSTVVKRFQHVVLETATLAGVQFKNFPLVGAQAGTDEKPERARGEFSSRLTEVRKAGP